MLPIVLLFSFLLSINCAIVPNVFVSGTTYNVTLNDVFIRCDSSVANTIVNLPPASTCEGFRVTVVDETGQSETNVIYVNFHAGEQVNNNNGPFIIGSNFYVLSLYSTGANWVQMQT